MDQYFLTDHFHHNLEGGGVHGTAWTALGSNNAGASNRHTYCHDVGCVETHEIISIVMYLYIITQGVYGTEHQTICIYSINLCRELEDFTGVLRPWKTKRKP